MGVHMRWRFLHLVSEGMSYRRLLGCASRVLRSVPETRQMLEQAMHETLAVAQARKITLLDDAICKTIAFVDTLPYRRVEQLRCNEILWRGNLRNSTRGMERWHAWARKWR